MPDVPFHLTRNGRLFYERTMPELVRQLARMNDLLERLAVAQVAKEPDLPRWTPSNPIAVACPELDCGRIAQGPHHDHDPHPPHT